MAINCIKHPHEEISFDAYLNCVENIPCRVSGTEMKKNRFTSKFWMVLATLNILAMVYPIKAYVEADNNSMHARFVAALLVVGVNFVLAMIDAVALAIASA